MGRRFENGVVGNQGSIGQISITTNTISTTQTNTDLILDPQGTGTTQIVGNMALKDQGQLRLNNTANTFYTILRSASGLTANRTLTFPDSNGSSGYVIQTDGSGNLSWVAQTAAGLTVSDQTSSGTVHYPLISTSTTGSITAINVSTTKLAYYPVSGILFSTIGQHPDVIGSTTASGTLTIRGNNTATKASASVLMTDGVASTTTATGTLVVTGGVGVSGQITTATLSATTITETSSIVLKENILPISNALDLITSLQGYIYDRKDGSSKNEAGLIAEEVYKVIPNLVKLDEEGNPASIQYTKLTAYLVECVKTLQEEIALLKGGK